MQYGELKKNILLKLDEYEPNSPNMTDDEDIAAKLPYVVNEAVRFAFYGKSYKRTWQVVQGEPFNAINEKTTAEHRTEDVVFEAAGGYGYYFEVDDTATVNIYENGNLLKTIEHTGGTRREYTAYKGRAGGGGTLKLEFTGGTYYRMRNVCIYNVLFSSDEKIPDYSGYYEHDIPSGLYKVEQVYLTDKNKVTPVAFRVTGDKLYLPDIAGEYEVISAFFPDTISSETPDDYEIDIPRDIEYVVVSKACAFLSQDGEYAEFVSDSEQGMQMLDADRGASRPVVRVSQRIM